MNDETHIFLFSIRTKQNKRQNATEKILSIASSVYIFCVYVRVFILFLASILQMNLFESSAVLCLL